MSPVRRRATPVLAFSGASGAGKTRLLVKLIPALVARGLSVVALKGSGHRHAFDRPGKDSARLRAAGAAAVALSGPLEAAYFGPPLRSMAEVLALLPAADLALAEGFKGAPVPRVEVHREAIDPAFLCARDRRVIAVVSDVAPPREVPWFRAREVEALADFVEAFARNGVARSPRGSAGGGRKPGGGRKKSSRRSGVARATRRRR